MARKRAAHLMLSDITITDLGVIEEARLDVGPGLTVVTGETGAGKTMVVTGLGLLLGGRGDSGLVRHGAGRAVVEGVATVPADHPARQVADDAGASAEDDLVLVRSVGADGRSRAHVGGRAAPISVLSELGQHLVAVHGQADQWRLRHRDQHRELLDRFGGENVAAAREAYAAAYATHGDAERELEDLRTNARERARERASLTAGLERIEVIDPQPGEDVALAEEAERLGHLEDLRQAAGGASTLLAGGEETSARVDPGILGLLGQVRGDLARAAVHDPALEDLAGRANDLVHLSVDLSSDLASYVAGLDVEPGRLDSLNARRAALTELTRAYGADIDEVLDWGRTAAARVADLSDDDDRIAELTESLSGLRATLDAAAGRLTEARRSAADILGARISDELVHLAMPNTVVAVDVSAAVRLTPTGADDVEIGMRGSGASGLRSISRSASGGELSRIMLAIEVATAEASDGPPTFVFDEVDAGIGGRAALAVGARLAELARHAQVIAVTHLAQVAAHADRHLVVRKADDGTITRTGVDRVEGEDRVAELARMLGGTDSSAALEHARDLIRRVSGA